MTRRERCEQYLKDLRALESKHENEGMYFVHEYVELTEAFAKEIEATLTSTWTTSKPTEEGWYWWRDKSNPKVWFQRIYLVYEMEDGRFEVDEGEHFVNIVNKGGEWSDRPIQGPGD